MLVLTCTQSAQPELSLEQERCSVAPQPLSQQRVEAPRRPQSMQVCCMEVRMHSTTWRMWPAEKRKAFCFTLFLGACGGGSTPIPTHPWRTGCYDL